MTPFDRFQKSTPAPRSRGDKFFEERFRSSAADSGSVARISLDYLREFREVEITTADGRTMIVLAKRARAGSASGYKLYWECTVESAGVVHVARGLVVHYTEDTTIFDLEHHNFTVPEKTLGDGGLGGDPLSDGDVIYVVITRGYGTPANNIAAVNVDTPATGTAVWIDTEYKANVGSNCYIAKLAGPLFDQHYTDDSPDLPASSAPGLHYIPIAIYHETDGVGSIEQLVIGCPIEAPYYRGYRTYTP